MKQNLYNFSLFLNTYNFSILKNCRRKTVWVVLIFDGFSIFRFFSLFFMGECLFPELVDISDLVLTLTLSKLNFTLFTGELSGDGWIQHVVLMLASVQTKILLQISLTGDGLFWCEEPVDQSSDFPLPPPCQITGLTLTSFIQQTKGHRVQIACPFSPLPL